MLTLVTAEAVHTHTHTHTSNLILTKAKHKSLCYLCNFVYSELYK